MSLSIARIILIEMGLPSSESSVHAGVSASDPTELERRLIDIPPLQDAPSQSICLFLSHHHSLVRNGVDGDVVQALTFVTAECVSVVFDSVILDIVPDAIYVACSSSTGAAWTAIQAQHYPWFSRLHFFFSSALEAGEQF